MSRELMRLYKENHCEQKSEKHNMMCKEELERQEKRKKNLLRKSQGSTESKWECETDWDIKNKLAFEFHN